MSWLITEKPAAVSISIFSRVSFNCKHGLWYVIQHVLHQYSPSLPSERHWIFIDFGCCLTICFFFLLQTLEMWPIFEGIFTRGCVSHHNDYTWHLWCYCCFLFRSDEAGVFWAVSIVIASSRARFKDTFGSAGAKLVKL